MPLQQNVDESNSLNELGLNNNFDLNVFEALKILVSPSEAIQYQTICEIFDEFLETGLYAYYEGTLCDTHIFLTQWILKENRNPNEILILVQHIFQIIIDKEEAPQKHGFDKNSFAFLFPVMDDDQRLSVVSDDYLPSSKYMRSWLVLSTLMSLSQKPNLIIEGTWENILYELLKYIRMWDIDSKFSVYCLTHRTVSTLKDNFCWDWLIETACSPTMCSNPYLRLEIFRLILLFDPDKKIFSNGIKIVTGYVECLSSINPDKLHVIMGNNLLSVRHLMLRICTLSLPWRLKHLISGKVVKDLHLNHIGKEVMFVANSMKVIGLFAQIAKTRYKTQSKHLRRCLNLCMYLLMFGHNNNFSENIYNHALLLPYTCCALADITDGILTLSSFMNDKNIGSAHINKSELDCHISKKRMSLYNKIVKRRNDLVDDLVLPKEQYMHVKLCQREQSSIFSNILFVKKTGLALPKLELGTICSDDIEPMSYYHNEEADDSHIDSDTESDFDSGTTFSDGDPVFSLDVRTSSSSESNDTGHSSVSIENSDGEELSHSGSRNDDTASIYSLETDTETD